MKEVSKYCSKCGKELSKKEIKEEKKKCEKCLEEDSSKITKALAVVGGTLVAIGGTAAFIVTRGKIGKK